MIYFAQLPTGAIKIGFSDDVESRLIQLKQHYRHPLSLLCTMEGGRETEREIHDRFGHLRIAHHREKEQFRPGADLLEFIGLPLLVNANPTAVEAVTSNFKPIAAHLRGSEQWKAWLEEFARVNRMSVAGLIDTALTRLAKELRFREPPER